MDKAALDIFPLVIIADRYNGTYSNAQYLAINQYTEYIPWQIGSGDSDEMNFWHAHTKEKDNHFPIGKGKTPNEALNDLCNKIKRSNNEILKKI